MLLASVKSLYIWLIVEYLKASADQGYAEAQVMLGAMYYDGAAGLPRDYAKAFELFSLAAEQGAPAAQYMLGVMYENGQGTGQNYMIAAEWYGKAAEQGMPEAQAALQAISTAIGSIG